MKNKYSRTARHLLNTFKACASVVLSGILITATLFAPATSVFAGENNSNEPDLLVVSTVKELIDSIDIDLDECFSTAVIDPEENTLIVDGDEAAPEEVFGKQAEEENITESIDAALTFFDERPYETEVQGDGTLEITSPYQMKRIIVHTDSLSEYCGAISAVYYPKASEYILEFDSPEQTKVAFEVLSNKYGDACYVDELISCEPFTAIPNDSWGYRSMGFQYAKTPADSVRQKTAVVAVIDTGIDSNSHYFESGRISEESYDLVYKTDDLTDSIGHGTHIAGIIAGCTSDLLKILMIRVFDENGKATWLLLDNALQYAMEHNVDVINMSLGVTTRFYESNYTALNAALEAAWEQKIPVICAAGNDGLNVSHVYPACNDYTIAVSAINKALGFAGTFNNGTGGSGYGEKIEFCAPGVDIASYSKDGEMTVKSGTSCSTAFVSAAFSYFKALYPEASVDRLINIAMENAIDLGIKGKDPYFGWGLIRFFCEESESNEAENIMEDDVSYACTPSKDTETEELSETETEIISIETASVTGLSRSYGYTNKAYTPSITVKVNGTELKKDVDFTVRYKNNKNPGTATIIVTGKGNYTGTRTKTFEIVDCASKPVFGKTYQLIPKNNTSTAVCSFAGKMVKNTKVYLTNRSSSEAMKFRAVKNSDGTWKLINAKCELALAVQQNSAEVGKGIVLYDQTTRKAQNWKMVKKYDNSYAIINAASGLSVTVSDQSAVKGTTLSMAETISSGLQRFYIVETTPAETPYDGTYSVRAAKSTALALNISSSSLKDGANVNLYKYNNSNAQKFRVIYSGGGYYRLVNVNSDLVLTVKGDSKSNGANVIQSSWKGLNGQRWKPTKSSDGTVILKNALGTTLYQVRNTPNKTNVIVGNITITKEARWYFY